jgi:hypothetical protein
MSSYKTTAVLAAELLKGGQCSDPALAWKQAAKKVFPTSQSLQDKGCPKGAFVGLCKYGLVVDVPASTDPKTSKNGEYAVLAVEVLKKNKLYAVSAYGTDIDLV